MLSVSLLIDQSLRLTETWPRKRYFYGWSMRQRLVTLVGSCMSSMASSPVLVGEQGGTIHQIQASGGELFQVCFRGQCLYCESLHVGMAHLNRMERIPVSAHTAAA